MTLKLFHGIMSILESHRKKKWRIRHENIIKNIFILSKSCESKQGALRQHRGSHCKKQVWPLGLEEQREENLEAPKKEPRSWDPDLWGHCLTAAAFSEGVPGGWSASEGNNKKQKDNTRLGPTAKAVVKNHCWDAADRTSRQTGGSKAFSPLLRPTLLLGLYTDRAHQAKEDVFWGAPASGSQTSTGGWAWGWDTSSQPGTRNT